MKEICHVCKKEKKPYTVIINDNILSIASHLDARSKGPICKRCNQYHAMTGEFKDATNREFLLAQEGHHFANNVLAWWKKDGPLNDEVNTKKWEGTHDIAKWYREKK